MRVLMAVTAFLPSAVYGGPATVALNVAEALVRNGHHVTIISSDIESLSPERHYAQHLVDMNGVEVRYFRTRMLRPSFPFLISRSMANWLKENLDSYDVVHVHFARDWIPVTVVRHALKSRVKVFLQPHGMLSRRDGVRIWLDRLVIANLLRRANRVLVLQEVDENSVKAVARDARVSEVPNGIFLKPDIPQWSLRQLESKTILFLARLHPRKKVLDLIEAARMLIERGHDIHFRIVGPDGGDLAESRRRTEDYGLSPYVSFVGPVDSSHVMAEYAAASVYVLPSVDEPFPMSVLEALAVGVPVVATTGIHIRQMLEQANAAMIVEPGPPSLANAICDLLDSPQKAYELSVHGKSLVEKKLGINNVVAMLESIYTG